MATVIQLRNDTAANWTSNNPLLAIGEMGVETDTNKTKIGDGVNNWNALPYSGGGSAIVETVVAGTDIAVDSADPANPIVSYDGQFDLPPNDGQHYSGTNTGGTFSWEHPEVNDLSDVETALPQTGQVLAYNDGTDQWNNQDLPEFFGAGTSGLVPDSTTEVNAYLRDDGTWAQPPVTPIGGTSLSYEWSSATTATQPADGDIRVNNADQTLATELYVSAVTRLGNDVSIFWANGKPGTYIGLWEEGNQGDESDYYLVTGDTVDNGGWFTVPVEHRSGTGGIDNNRNTTVFFIENPLAKIPEGGTAGQSLVKVSDTDFDTQWADTYESGSALPDPASYPEGFLFLVTS